MAVQNVSFSYGNVQVIHNVNLDIKEKDFLGIIGPNGGGKTTLLKIILGLLKPTQGDVTVFGQSPVEGRREIGYIPQIMNFDRNFPISVRDVVLMGCMPRRGIMKRCTSQCYNQSTEVLKSVDMLNYADHPMGQLSQGQQQRVFIARALAGNPKLLLMDEPTASVDPTIQSNFYSLLVKLNKDIPVVLVSHDIGVISAYVTKIACLNRELYYHDAKEITEEDFQKVYGASHRFLKEHKHG